MDLLSLKCLTIYYLNNIYVTIISNKLISLFYILLGLLAPLNVYLFCIACLVIFDFITGIYKSYKNNIPIESKSFKNSVVKYCLYVICLLTSWILSFVAKQDVIFTIAISLICLVEVKSIFENVDSILGTSIFSNIYKIFEKKIEDKNK